MLEVLEQVLQYIGGLRMLVSEGRLTTSEYGRDSDLLGFCTSRVCPPVLHAGMGPK